MKSPDSKNAVAVVHLVWLPYGIQLLKSFIDSYKKYSSGYDHDLYILFNGVSNKFDIVAYENYLTAEGINYKAFYKESGQDVEAYSWIAKQLNSTYILFLNGFAVLLADDWLAKYVNVITQPAAGAVSATASYGSLYSHILQQNSWRLETKKGITFNYRKYKLLLKTLLVYRFYFKPFPNPHLRTNSFIINRNLFLSLSGSKASNKFGAYLFENGRNSMSLQLKKQKLRLYVLDKQGNVYEEAGWPAHCPFWNKRQENLLVSDNQTNLYTNGDNLIKEQLSYLAWGK